MRTVPGFCLDAVVTELFLNDEEAHRDSAGGDDVGGREPDAVIAFEVTKLMGEDGLHLCWRQQLQESAVHHDEGLAPRDRQGVSVGARVLRHQTEPPSGFCQTLGLGLRSALRQHSETTQEPAIG